MVNSELMNSLFLQKPIIMKALLFSVLSLFISTTIAAQDTLVLRPASDGKDANIFSNNGTKNYGSDNGVTI